MKSVDQMSDAELDSLLKESATKPKSVESMSDEELDALLAKPESKESVSGYGPAATFAGNALDTLTLDHGPNIISAIKNMSVSSPEYIKDRDSHRAQLEQGKEDNPVARYAGATTGAIAPIAATLFAPEATIPAYGAEALEAANAAKAAAPSLMKTFGKNMLIGEAMSGLQNPGDVKGKVSGLQLDDRLNNMTDPVSVGINAATAGAGSLVENKLATMARDKDQLAFKALRPSAKNTENLVDIGEQEITPDRASKIGSTIKNMGILEGSPDITEIARRVAKKKDEIGEKIGSLFADNSSKVKYDHPLGPLRDYNPEQLVDVLNKKYEGDGEAAKAVADKVSEIISSRAANKGGQLALDDLQTIRQNIQSKVNYNRLYTSELDQTKNEMMNDAANYFNKLIYNEIEKNAPVLGKDASSKLRVANNQYGLLSDAGKISSKAAAKAITQDSAQGFIEKMIPSLGTGLGVGAVSHSPLAGVATAGATMAAKGIAPRADAMAANLAANPLVKKAQPLVGYGANLLQHNMIPPEIPPPSPYMIDQKIKNDDSLPPSQKAKLRMQNKKMSR